MSLLNRKSAPRFLLYGIGGVYNYGCEAIVRGTTAILRKEWPACDVIYASRRPDEDRRALSDCPIVVYDAKLPRRFSPKHLLWGTMCRLGLDSSGIYDAKARTLADGCDCILSIGGDIFTLARPPYRRWLPDIGLTMLDHVTSRGVPYVLWGASVGPFDAWPTAAEKYEAALRRVSLVTAREALTAQYLSSSGVNTSEVADPAFLMDAEVRETDWPWPSTEEPVIGLNISPYWLTYTQGDREKARRQLSDSLLRIVSEHHAHLLLIPHVIIPGSPADDDHAFLHGLFRPLKAVLRDRVALLPPDLGARRTKGVIARCHALIAARMHCGIAGVSAGVPTLFLVYSRKAEGMARYVYGDDIGHTPLGNFHDVGRERVRALLLDHARMSQLLATRAPLFKADAHIAGKALRGVLENAGA